MTKHENNLILDGAASLIASLDVYYKGTNNFEHFIPEGCEVTNSSSLMQNDHIPVAQYMSKADGYMRFYLKTGFEEYLSLSDQIISKVIRTYEATRAEDGTHWFPLIDLVDAKGVAHSYDQGPDNYRVLPSIFWDQSKAKVTTKKNSYGDAFGLGMYELSKKYDKLPPEFKSKLINICEIYIDFFHKKFVLHDDGEKYYWRTDDFYPSSPKIPIPEPAWGFLGQDILYMMMAYLNLEGYKSIEYYESLYKFIRFYIKFRTQFNHIPSEERYKRSSPIWRIEYLDIRMLAVSDFLIEKNKPIGLELKSFTVNLAKSFYVDLPPTRTCIGGETITSASTAPMLEIFRRIDSGRFKLLWQNFTRFDIGINGFSYSGLKPPAVNFSVYPIFLDYGYNAWQNKVISDEEFSGATRRFYTLFGNPKFLRNNESWCKDITTLDKLLTEWQAVPGRCYVENVMPEGVWENGEAQGYTSIWPGGFRTRSLPKYRHLSLERNVYTQFCAPFQPHANPFSYGNAFDYNLLYTRIKENDNADNSKDFFVACRKESGLPKDMPSYGAVDVTDIYCLNKCFHTPANFQIKEVLINGRVLPFKTIKILEYHEEGSPIDNVKLVFVVPFSEENEFQIKVEIEKRENNF